jgi:exodeoxyribonuclease-3
VAPTAIHAKADHRPPVWQAGIAARTRAATWVFCRSDYHLPTPGVAALARKEAIHIEPRFSDHAPLTIDCDFTL